jgi:succinoglycan biosynthesis transport protein ExoP
VVLRDYLAVIRARKWLIVLSVVAVALLAVAISFLQKPVYQGVAQILVTQQNLGITMLGTPSNQLNYQPERDVQTQVRVIQSRGVAEKVIKSLGLSTTYEQLLNRITVTADIGTNVIEIRATDASAEGAARIANSFAEQCVAWSQDSQRRSIKAAADDVESRLARAQEQIVKLEAAAYGSSASSAEQVRLRAATTLYETLADKLEQLRIAEQLATGTASVLSPAAVDPDRVSPNHMRDGALGLILGLVFGLGTAFLLDFSDTTIKSVEEAEKVYGAPVLGDIPTEEPVEGETRRVPVALTAGGPAAEAYRVLRNNLDFINVDKDIKVLLISSSVPSEGKSTVAANLATVLAKAGKRVILVVCDFHRPSTGQFSRLDHRVGLSDVLRGTLDLQSAVQQPEAMENLLVIAAGTLPPNPSELLASEAMGRLMTALRDTADFVILDSAPVLVAADAAAVARWVDGVIMVTHAGVSTRQDGKAGRQMLDKVGAHTVGVVIWGLKEGSTSFGSYHYGRYTSESEDGK